MSNQANAAENKDEMRMVLKRILDEQQRQAKDLAKLGESIKNIEARLRSLESGLL